MFVSLEPTPGLTARLPRLVVLWPLLKAEFAVWLDEETGTLPGAFRFFDAVGGAIGTLGFAEKVDKPGMKSLCAVEVGTPFIPAAVPLATDARRVLTPEVLSFSLDGALAVLVVDDKP